MPFRLTQNVIDGFGVSGVEGVFRKSAETALSVLRHHRGAVVSDFWHLPEWAYACAPRSEHGLCMMVLH